MINLPKSFKLIFKCIAGSRLYGTSTPQSDWDERGVFIPDENYFYGFLNRTEQYEDKNNDITYWEIRKFLQLAMENNPNIIEILFVPKDKWLQYSNEWEEIYENRELFVSKKCKHTFLGYAHSQFHRIKLHRHWIMNPPTKKPTREDYGLSPYKSDLTKDQIGAFNVLLALKLENIKEYHPLKIQLEEMHETYEFKGLCQNFKEIDINAVQEIMPISTHFLQILQKENAYAQAEREFNQYIHWKEHRNPERYKLEENFKYDCKHASHLIRLISEGAELLTKGNITLPRPDAEFLLEIKNGVYKYEEIADLLESYEKKFEVLYETSTLPFSADKVEIDKLCQKLTKNFLLNTGEK